MILASELKVGDMFMSENDYLCFLVKKISKMNDSDIYLKIDVGVDDNSMQGRFAVIRKDCKVKVACFHCVRKE